MATTLWAAVARDFDFASQVKARVVKRYMTVSFLITADALKNEETTKMAASTSKPTEIGLVKKMVKSPRDISSELRIARSIIGPRMIVRIVGAMGKSSFL